MNKFLRMDSSIYSEIYFMVPIAPKSMASPVEIQSLDKRTQESLDRYKELLGIPQVKIEDRVAIIPVSGVLSKNVSPIEELYRFKGYEAIEQDIIDANDDEEVDAIVLQFDSPGGSAVGALETASVIAELTTQGKPIISFCDSLMASAAYYIGRGTKGIIATPSAIVGSVGTYMLMYDFAQMVADMGVKVDLLKSGAHKGAGEFGTSLTEAQRTQLQGVVDTLGAQFREFVHERADIDDQYLQGQAYVATDALQFGLIDALGTLDDAKEKALELAQS